MKETNAFINNFLEVTQILTQLLFKFKVKFIELALASGV